MNVRSADWRFSFDERGSGIVIYRSEPPLLGKITVAAPPRAQYVEARGMLDVSFESL